MVVNIDLFAELSEFKFQIMFTGVVYLSAYWDSNLRYSKYGATGCPCNTVDVFFCTKIPSIKLKRILIL